MGFVGGSGDIAAATALPHIIFSSILLSIQSVYYFSISNISTHT